MSSGEDLGASVRMPNQANGYSILKSWRLVSGICRRQKEREPSAPTSTSQCTSNSVPSASVKRNFGVSVSRSSSSVTSAEKRTSPPSSSRAAARSTKTSFCA